MPQNNAPLNTGSKAGNAAIQTGFRIGGSLIPIPGAGSAIGGLGVGLTTGDWNWRNFVPMGNLLFPRSKFGGMMGPNSQVPVFSPLGGSPFGSFSAGSLRGWDTSFESGGGGGWLNGSVMGGFPNLPTFYNTPSYGGDPLALAISQAALSPGFYAQPNMAGAAPMDSSAMYANTVPQNGIQNFTSVGNPASAAPNGRNPGYAVTLNSATPYQTAFSPNAFGGNYDTGQRFYQQFGGGLRDGDPTTSGVCFSGNTRLKDLGRFDQFSADQIVTLPDGRKAQVLIHDHDGPMRDMGNDELVTPDHPFQHNGQLVPASALFPDEVPFTGKVYNLHVLTDQESERLYDLENGHRVHNKIPLASLTGSALSWFQ